MGGTSHPESVGTNNHIITANSKIIGATYDDIAARDADTAFNTSSGNIGKTVKILTDPFTYYVLLTIAPTWRQSAWPTYQNIAARDADSAFNTTLTNVDKIVRVEVPLSFYILTSNAPTWSEFSNTGNNEFIELTDTFSSYTGLAGKVLQVNVGETAIEAGQALRISDSPVFAGLQVTGALKDSSGDPGTSGQILSSTVTGTNWITDLSVGDVIKVGTPVDNQVGVWTGDGTLEGDIAFTFDTSTNILKIGNGISDPGGNLIVSGFFSPTFEMVEGDSSFNNRRWQTFIDNGVMNHSLLTNAGAATPYQTITRSLSVATSIAFNTTTLSTSNAMSVAGNLIVDTDTLIVDSSLDRVTIGNSATGLTDLTIFQGSNNLKGLTFSGEGVTGSSTTEGVSLLGGFFNPGNTQLWITNKVDQGNAAKNSFRFLVGGDLPTIIGVNNTNTTNKNLCFGTNVLGAGSAFGFPIASVQGDVDAKVHVSTGVASEVGLITQGVTSQTADLFQAKNVGDTVMFAIAADGALKDSSGDKGTAGQILSSTATGTNWINNAVGNVTTSDTLTDEVMLVGNGGVDVIAAESGTGARIFASPNFERFHVQPETGGIAKIIVLNSSANESVEMFHNDSANICGIAAPLNDADFAITSNGSMILSSNTALTFNSDNNDIVFVTIGNNTRMRLTNAGQLKIIDGTELLPSYAFINDADTGIRRVSEDILGFSAKGFDVLHLTAIASSLNHLEISASGTANPVLMRGAGQTNVNVSLSGNGNGFLDLNTDVGVGEVRIGRKTILGGATLKVGIGGSIAVGQAAETAPSVGDGTSAEFQSLLGQGFVRTRINLHSPTNSNSLHIGVNDTATDGGSAFFTNASKTGMFFSTMAGEAIRISSQDVLIPNGSFRVQGGVVTTPTLISQAVFVQTADLFQAKDNVGNILFAIAADGAIKDSSGDKGASGQVLSSTVTGTNWIGGATAGTVKFKEPVRAATTMNGALATAYENTDAIDNVTLVTGDRILLKNQTIGSENGIYTVNASGAPTRATDFDANAEVSGSAFNVLEGDVNSKVVYKMINTGSLTVGTTALVFKDIEDHINFVNIRGTDDWGTLEAAPDGEQRVKLVGATTYRIHADHVIPLMWMPEIPTPEQFSIVDFDFVNSSILLLCEAGDTAGAPAQIWGRRMGALLCKEGNFVDVGNSEAGLVTTLFNLVGVDANSLLAMQFTLIFGFKKCGHTMNVFHDHTDSLFQNNVGGFVVNQTADVASDNLVRAVTFRHSVGVTFDKPVYTFLGSPNTNQIINSTIDLLPNQDFICLDAALSSSTEIVANPYPGATKGDFFSTSSGKAIITQAADDITIDSFETGGTGKTKMVFSAVQDFTIGQTILIADEAAYDGLRVITDVDDDQKKFTFNVTFSTAGPGTLKMVKHTLSSHTLVRGGTVTITDTTNNGTFQILRETDTTFHTPDAFTAGDLAGTAAFFPLGVDTVGVKTLSNGAQRDSNAIGAMMALANSTATVIGMINTWTDLNLNALAASSSNNSRWTLTNTTTGEQRYEDVNPIRPTLVASISCSSTGGSQEFEFRLVVNGSPTSDAVVASSEIGSDTVAIPLEAGMDIVQNDLVRVQVQNIDGTSNITIKNFTVQVKI